MTVIQEKRSPGPPQNASCRFCKLTASEVPIIETPIGLAIPSIGAFVEGWLLVVPRRHMVALSDLRDWELTEFQDLMEEASDLVSREYGPIVMFEHGPAGAGRSAGCGIDHAHLHIVPHTLNLHEAVKSDGAGGNLRWRPAALPWDAHADHSSGLDYFYVRETDGSSWLTSTSAAPSQLLRRAIASQVGTPVWDWKADPRSDLVAATYRRLLGSANVTVRE
jgi:ATP adenylyltransferase